MCISGGARSTWNVRLRSIQSKFHVKRRRWLREARPWVYSGVSDALELRGPNHRSCQSEGRRGKDHDRGQPRREPRRG